VSIQDAREMLNETRAAVLLEGVRGDQFPSLRSPAQTGAVDGGPTALVPAGVHRL
jgi:hypothetical protein